MADNDQSVSVHVKDLLDLDDCGMVGDDLKTFREIVTRKPIKVELEVMIPASTSKDDALSAAKDHCKKTGQLLAKQASAAFPIVVECYREDKNGSTKAYGEAEAALSKFNKFVEQRIEQFRVELRKA